MKNTRRHRMGMMGGAVLSGLLGLLAGCRPADEPVRWQGYLEGEYVHVATPAGGELEGLYVRRGDRVEAGDALFALDSTAATSEWWVAGQNYEQAKSRLADLEKGLRPAELAALEARLAQARAAAELAEAEERRVQRLRANDVVAEEAWDQARAEKLAAAARVAELEAELAAAQLGAREDQLAEAKSVMVAARSVVEVAEHRLMQQAPRAPVAGLVFDTLYQVGEMVSAGQPVVVLLPPENLKVRFWVPEAARATLAVGDPVQVNLSGGDEPVAARVVYLSPEAEFTVPMLYNRENRAKLVYMIEAEFADDAGVELRPGQPVDVTR